MKAKGKQAKYTLETVEQIALKLKALPKMEAKKKELNKSEAVNVLAKEIKSLQKRDYTLKMIAEILTTHEFDISESVLKSYLKRAEVKSTTEPTTEEAKSAKSKAVEEEKAAKEAAQAANEEANPATAPKNTDATESTLDAEVNADKKNKTTDKRNKTNNFVDI